MLTRIKNFIYVYKVLKTGAHTQGMYQILISIFQFAEQVAKEQRPMLTRIAVMDVSKGKEVMPVVDLWAGCGDANPIHRIKQLKAQNSAMKSILRRCLSASALQDKNLATDIEIVIDTFE